MTNIAVSFACPQLAEYRRRRSSATIVAHRYHDAVTHGYLQLLDQEAGEVEVLVP
jgi:hypothetical protein